MSAIGDLRLAPDAGGDITPNMLRAAILELDDRVASIERAIFPPAPQAADPAVIAAQPITTERPQLSGSVDVQIEVV